MTVLNNNTSRPETPSTPWTKPNSRSSTTNPMPPPARLGSPPFVPNWPGAASTVSSCPIRTNISGEYLPTRAERLAWLTAFTGSAGAAVVLKDKAAVFVDGRYTLQVRQQTDTKLFEPRDLVAEGPTGYIEKRGAQGRQARLRPMAAHPGRHRASAEGRREGRRDAGARPTAIRSTRCGAISPPPPTAKATPHAMNLAGESGRIQTHAHRRGREGQGRATRP